MTAAQKLWNEGKEEGRKQGKAEVIEEGKRESQLSIARNMLREKVNSEQISKFTGLDLMQIETLAYDQEAIQ
ncbi:MAG: hypothetical protein AAFU83_00700 [Bacteroidota bacterium]